MSYIVHLLVSKASRDGSEAESIKNVLDTTNTDIFIKRSDDEIRTTLNAIEKSEIVYKLWKRVKLEDGSHKMKELSFNLSKDEFVALMVKEVSINSMFREHVRRLNAQYDQIRHRITGIKIKSLYIQSSLISSMMEKHNTKVLSWCLMKLVTTPTL